MDDQDYSKRVDAALKQVADWLEAFDPDVLDYQTSDGVITLSFADKTRFVLNRQSAVHQVWFAAGARAWHYVWDAARAEWVDERDGHGLYGNLERTVAAKLGSPVPPVGGPARR
ncbi:MAG: iron donor protein CyaY [Planctomycetes bacterium]|jgi:CyaY protein|nr:iron donor protein CyaY [Planctomycetota bacterium]